MELWLSVRQLMSSPLPASQLNGQLMKQVDGIHVDVHPNDPSTVSADFVASLHTTWPESAYDLHFIEDRTDATAIVSTAKLLNHRLRRVYAPSTANHSQWSPAIAASDVLSGDADPLLRAHSWVVVTAPPPNRDAFARVDIVRRAVAHVAVAAQGNCKVTLDRDISRLFASDDIRCSVSEIVVGKAILATTDPARAASEMRLTWGMQL